MAHVLDNPLTVCDYYDLQHNELMALTFKAFFYRAARGKLISIPRQTEMTEFAGKVNPRAELQVLKQYLVESEVIRTFPAH